MKLCLALNTPSKLQDAQILKELGENLESRLQQQLFIKIGLQGFIRDGLESLQRVKSALPDSKIFLDLKLYDIPNTMLEAVIFCNDLGVDMLTVHASSGKVAISLLSNELSKLKNPPLLFAVTALTSFDESSFAPIYKQGVQEAVLNLAKLSYDFGADGVVCSVHESLAIKNATSRAFLTLCPGIRFDIASANESFGCDDQKRVASIDDAKKSLADYIVIGRPILQSKNPCQKVRQILKELESESF